MKLTTRISKDEIREQTASIVATINTGDMPQSAREYLAALVLEETERIANHAFSQGRLFERRNPITPPTP